MPRRPCDTVVMRKLLWPERAQPYASVPAELAVAPHRLPDPSQKAFPGRARLGLACHKLPVAGTLAVIAAPEPAHPALPAFTSRRTYGAARFTKPPLGHDLRCFLAAACCQVATPAHRRPHPSSFRRAKASIRSLACTPAISVDVAAFVAISTAFANRFFALAAVPVVLVRSALVRRALVRSALVRSALVRRALADS